jgi:hypothetical protein
MRPTMLVLGTTAVVVALTQSGAPAQPPPPQPIIGNAPPSVLRGAAATPWLDPPVQLPSIDPPPTPLPQTAQTSPVPASQRFDTASLRLLSQSGRWQLWAGNLLLKDFGAAERDASEALQVFRDLRVNSHASVSDVFEYWLTDGQAPYAFTGRRQVIPFDLHTLRVEQMNGQWVLRDAHVVLYSFGRSQADAQTALAVCRQYEFNQLGYVGHPVPPLKYLLKDPTPRQSGPVPQSLIPVSAVMQPAEMAHPRLVLPGVGDVGDRAPFDGRRLDLRRDGGEWVLYAGRMPVGHFGQSDRDARTALETLEQFRVTELCHIGDSGFGFFLTNGRPPQGSIIGTGAKHFRPESLNVRQIGGNWAVCEETRPLFDFGEKADDARHVLAAIKEYHFDHVAQVGNGRLGNVYLFVKSGY